MEELSGLTLGVIKLGFLAVLWLFVLTAVGVMRSDLFGTRLARRGTGSGGAIRAERPARASRAPKEPRRRRGAPTTLVVTEGPLAGTTVPLGPVPITVGRAPDNTIVLADDYASGHHARLFGQDDEWYVEDLGSTNGTWVERTRVASPTSVRAGVPVRVGRTVLELRK
ncbi:type III secretion system (T3SS) inner membrane Yop/YscD-like protein [Motilibacter peucedani]|uniref:Type III secretion system (T3SS) inner membrane Yop/YscD-like protein n=1 Tax=Motilibacter peucedani TaxID=598650 RepID=A0A420XU25_9ACTN|nr:FHA domain-containing protein [Motilibacter peucedani]RKS80335.1 type III secretion system (T3SS) inner membrane Yop/YscD-like protein [Motilibacter peucedani]